MRCSQKKLQMKREKNGTGISFPKRKEEQDEATCLMEEKKKSVVVTQQTSFEAEQSPCNALREYVEGCDRDQGSARTLMTRCRQLMQRRDTKNMNLEKDLEDMHSTARNVGWCEEEKTTNLWKQLEGDEQKAPQP